MTAATLTLTDFLLARIAEDEKAAWDVPAGDLDPCYECGHETDLVDGFDPARVLAECAAKRAIVDFCRAPMIWVGHGGTPQTDTSPSDFVPGGSAPHDSRVLKLLASIYADHEDYRAEWAS